MSPGAFSWNQGVVLVLRTVPQAKASRHPADTALKKTLSRRILPLATPARPTNSITSAGVKASRLICDMLFRSLDPDGLQNDGSRGARSADAVKFEERKDDDAWRHQPIRT
ncbi:unnamed protein product [Aspergillus oryzae]|nr:unnamed protein product [Aspergillus oryzae]GMF91118.1 unnamed protein product [Aspergillus oryzae]